MPHQLPQLVYGKTVQSPGGPIHPNQEHRIVTVSRDFDRSMLDSFRINRFPTGFGGDYQWEKYPFDRSRGCFITLPFIHGNAGWVAAARLRLAPEGGEGTASRAFSSCHLAIAPAEVWSPGLLLGLFDALDPAPRLDGDAGGLAPVAVAEDSTATGNTVPNLLLLAAAMIQGLPAGYQSSKTNPRDALRDFASMLAALPAGISWRIPLGVGLGGPVDEGLGLCHGQDIGTPVRVVGERLTQPDGFDPAIGESALALLGGRLPDDFLRIIGVAPLELWPDFTRTVLRASSDLRALQALETWLANPSSAPPPALPTGDLLDKAISRIADAPADLREAFVPALLVQVNDDTWRRLARDLPLARTLGLLAGAMPATAGSDRYLAPALDWRLDGKSAARVEPALTAAWSKFGHWEIWDRALAAAGPDPNRPGAWLSVWVAANEASLVAGALRRWSRSGDFPLRGLALLDRYTPRIDGAEPAREWRDRARLFRSPLSVLSPADLCATAEKAMEVSIHHHRRIIGDARAIVFAAAERNAAAAERAFCNILDHYEDGFAYLETLLRGDVADDLVPEELRSILSLVCALGPDRLTAGLRDAIARQIGGLPAVLICATELLSPGRLHDEALGQILDPTPLVRAAGRRPQSAALNAMVRTLLQGDAVPFSKHVAAAARILSRHRAELGQLPADIRGFARLLTGLRAEDPMAVLTDRQIRLLMQVRPDARGQVLAHVGDFAGLAVLMSDGAARTSGGSAMPAVVRVANDASRWPLEDRRWRELEAVLKNSRLSRVDGWRLLVAPPAKPAWVEREAMHQIRPVFWAAVICRHRKTALKRSWLCEAAAEVGEGDLRDLLSTAHRERIQVLAEAAEQHQQFGLLELVTGILEDRPEERRGALSGLRRMFGGDRKPADPEPAAPEAPSSRRFGRRIWNFSKKGADDR